MLTKKEIRIHLKMSASTFQRKLKEIFIGEEYEKIKYKKKLDHSETILIYKFVGLG